MNFAGFRQRFPQFADRSDEYLLERMQGVYDNYYKDELSFDEYLAKIAPEPTESEQIDQTIEGGATPGPAPEKMDVPLGQEFSAPEERDENGYLPIDPDRPVITDEAGNHSELTESREVDGKEVLIRTVVDGKILDSEEAWQLWREGKNPEIGRFDSVEEANTFAENRTNELGRIGLEREEKQRIDPANNNPTNDPSVPSVEEMPEPQQALAKEEAHKGLEDSIYGKRYQDATAGPAELEETQYGKPYTSARDLIDRDLPDVVEPGSPEELAALSFVRTKLDNGYKPGWLSGTARSARGTLVGRSAGIYKFAADALDNVNSLYKKAADKDSDIVMAGRDWLDETGSAAEIDSVYNRMIADYSSPENAFLKIASDGLRAVPDMADVIAVTALTRNPNYGYAVMAGDVFADTYGRSRYVDQKSIATSFYDAAYAAAAEVGMEKAFDVLAPIAEGLPGYKNYFYTGLREGASESGTEVLTIFDELTRQNMPFEGYLAYGERILKAGGTGVVAGNTMQLGGNVLQALDNKMTMGKFKTDFDLYLKENAQAQATNALDPEKNQAPQLRKANENATVYATIMQVPHEMLMGEKDYQAYYDVTDMPGITEDDRQKLAKENYANHVVTRKRYEDIFREEGMEPIDLEQTPVGILNPDGSVTMDVPAPEASMEKLDLGQPLEPIPDSSRTAPETPDKSRISPEDNVTSVADYYSTEGARDLSHRVKSGDRAAIDEMAGQMATNIPKGSVLVPVPSRTGKATETKALAEKLAELTGSRVADIVEGDERESVYDIKKRGEKVPDGLLNHRLAADVPEGNVVVVDSVYDTGATANSVSALIPGSTVSVYAKVDTPKTVDAEAHEAASSPENDLPEPTEAQIEAGNYKKGHIKLHGLDISIENPVGSTRARRGGETVMQDHYGYIKRTIGNDQDQIDIFVGPEAENTDRQVHIVHQNHDDGSFDEHKVMLGYESQEAAKAAYLRNYEAGFEERIEKIDSMSLDDFKTWLGNVSRETSEFEQAKEKLKKDAGTTREKADIGGVKVSYSEEKDDFLSLLAKGPGLNIESWVSEGVERNETKDQNGLRFAKLFRHKGGLTKDGVADVMMNNRDSLDIPWPDGIFDEYDRVDANAALQWVMDLMSGRADGRFNTTIEEEAFREKEAAARGQFIPDEVGGFEVDNNPAFKRSDYLDDIEPADRAFMDWAANAITLGGSAQVDAITAKFDANEIEIEQALEEVQALVAQLTEKQDEANIEAGSRTGQEITETGQETQAGTEEEALAGEFIAAGEQPDLVEYEIETYVTEDEETDEPLENPYWDRLIGSPGFDSYEEALEFGDAEVGAPWRIVGYDAGGKSHPVDNGDVHMMIPYKEGGGFKTVTAEEFEKNQGESFDLSQEPAKTPDKQYTLEDARAKLKAKLEGTEDIPVESVEGGLFDGSAGQMDITDQIEAQEELPDNPWEMTLEQFQGFAKGGRMRQATGRNVPGEDQAETALKHGELNEYSPADIAHFYLTRRGGNEYGYQEYISDALFEGKYVPDAIIEQVYKKDAWEKKKAERDTKQVESPKEEYRLNRSEQIYGEQEEDSAKVLEIAWKLNQEALEVWDGEWMPYTAENREIVIDNMLPEVLAAYEKTPGAVGWYKENLAEAMKYAASAYPELATDKNAEQAFKFIMAITSNGKTVVTNAALTNLLYKEYRKTKSFLFKTKWDAKEGRAMRKAFSSAEGIVKRVGFDDFVKFLHTTYTVRELTEQGYEVNGEAMETVLTGSAIFGPKVGGAFLQNLNGNFDPVTFDMWWQRTWGRHTGTLFAKESTIKKQQVKLRSHLGRNKATVERLGYTVEELRENDQMLNEFAIKVYGEFSKGGFKNKTKLNNASRNLFNSIGKMQSSPRSAGERAYMREVVFGLRNRLSETGIQIDPADIQALLWYAEKMLYAKMGAKSSIAKEDYAQAWQGITKSTQVHRPIGEFADTQYDTETGGRRRRKSAEKEGKPLQKLEGQVSETSYSTREGESGPVQEPGTDGVQGELFTPPKSDAKPAEVPGVKLVQAGTFNSAITKTSDPEEIAHIVAPLRKDAQESLLVVVTDVNKNVLGIIRHTTGGVASSMVYQGIAAGAAASFPGARNIWLVHNHPSGDAQQSTADVQVTQRFDDLTKNTGLITRGMIVVFPGGTATFHEIVDSGAMFKINIKPGVRDKKIPVMTRKLAKRPDLTIEQVSSSAAAVNFMKQRAKGEPGVLFMDVRNRPLRFVPMTEEEFRVLRTGDVSTGAARLMRIAHETNASAAIINAPFIKASRPTINRQKAYNVVALLRAIEVDAFDTVIDGDTTLRSVGYHMPADQDFKSVSEIAGRGVKASELEAALRESLKGQGFNVDKLLAKLRIVQNYREIPARTAGQPISRYSLAMDKESRVARALKYGWKHQTYHGTTYILTEFDPTKTSADSYWGRGYYSTTSPDDAQINYASIIGGDLTMKIQKLAEELESADELDDDATVKPREDYLRQAQEELYGGSDNVLNLRVRMENPFRVSGQDETFLEATTEIADAEPYLDEAKATSLYAPEDFDTKEEYEEKMLEEARELAIEDSYNFEPTGPLMDFIYSIQNSNEITGVRDELVDRLWQLAYDGGVTASELDRIMREEQEWWAEDDTGNLNNAEVYRQALEDAGFDGVIDSGVYRKFGQGRDFGPGMEGIYPDTKHFIAFNPNQMRSIDAAYDPDRLDSRDLRASTSVEDEIEGVYRDRKVWMIADNISSVERGAWVAWHELWHRGARIQYGYGFNEMLKAAGNNSMVAKLADAILTDRKRHMKGSDPNARMIAIEEAMAELNAALRTGDFEALNRRYPGVNITNPDSETRSLVARFMEYLRKLLGKITGKQYTSDAEVWEVVRGVDLAAEDATEEAYREARKAASTKTPLYYSKMLATVRDGPTLGMPKNGKPEVFKMWINGQIKKGNMKKTEVDAIGVFEWLDSQENVTRQDLIDFVAANEIEVVEILRGPPAQPSEASLAPVLRITQLPSNWSVEPVDMGDPNTSYVVLDENNNNVLNVATWATAEGARDAGIAMVNQTLSAEPQQLYSAEIRFEGSPEEIDEGIDGILGRLAIEEEEGTELGYYMAGHDAWGRTTVIENGANVEVFAVDAVPLSIIDQLNVMAEEEGGNLVNQTAFTSIQAPPNPTIDPTLAPPNPNTLAIPPEDPEMIGWPVGWGIDEHAEEGFYVTDENGERISDFYGSEDLALESGMEMYANMLADAPRGFEPGQAALPPQPAAPQPAAPQYLTYNHIFQALSGFTDETEIRSLIVDAYNDVGAGDVRDEMGSRALDMIHETYPEIANAVDEDMLEAMALYPFQPYREGESSGIEPPTTGLMADHDWGADGPLVGNQADRQYIENRDMARIVRYGMADDIFDDFKVALDAANSIADSRDSQLALDEVYDDIADWISQTVPEFNTDGGMDVELVEAVIENQDRAADGQLFPETTSDIELTPAIAQEIFEITDGNVDLREPEPVAAAALPAPKLPTKWSTWQEPGAENYRELVLVLPGPDVGMFKDHFQDNNQIMHVRFNERELTVNGRIVKSLFIEELQSDHHQRGRKYGYKKRPKISPEKRDQNLTKLNKLIIENDMLGFDAPRQATAALLHNTRPGNQARARWAAAERGTSMYAGYEWNSIEDANSARRMVEIESEARAESQQDNNRDAVVDAPFKESKSWAMLGVKRMLRWAAENGFDSISWTPGSIQAERYNQARHFSEITVTHKQIDGKDEWNIRGHAREGGVVNKTVTSINELESHLGEELAAKAISRLEEQNNTRSLARPRAPGVARTYEDMSTTDLQTMLETNDPDGDYVSGSDWNSAEEWREGLIEAARLTDGGERPNSLYDWWQEVTGEHNIAGFGANAPELTGDTTTAAPNTIVLENIDLETGGEGMKGFYDKILVKETNKYVRKWGAAVGQVMVSEALSNRGGTVLRDETELIAPDGEVVYTHENEDGTWAVVVPARADIYTATDDSGRYYEFDGYESLDAMLVDMNRVGLGLVRGKHKPFEAHHLIIPKKMRKALLNEPQELFSKKAPMFYSKLARTVRNGAALGMPKKGKSDVFKMWLDGQQRKGNLKQEEREWLDLDNWLDDQRTVTRDAFIEHVERVSNIDLGTIINSGAGSGVVVSMGSWEYEPMSEEELEYQTEQHFDSALEDVAELADVDVSDIEEGSDLWEAAKEQAEALAEQNWPDAELTPRIRMIDVEFNHPEIGSTLLEYHIYWDVSNMEMNIVGKGGRHLDTDFGESIYEGQALDDARLQRLIQGRIYDEVDDERAAARETQYESFQLKGPASDYTEILVTYPELEGDAPSDHWEDEKVIYHARFNTRGFSVDGKIQTVMFAEEIQSDLHQAGREYGYYEGPSDKPGWTAKRRPDSDDEFSPAWDVYDQEGTHRYVSYGPNETDAIAMAFAGTDDMKPPQAPFKKSWHMHAFKRLVYRALENNMDGIAWTTGAHQNYRWRLSQVVRGDMEVERLPVNTAAGNPVYKLMFTEERTGQRRSEVFNDKELDRAVGKAVGNLIREKWAAVDANRAKWSVKRDPDSFSGFWNIIQPNGERYLDFEGSVVLQPNKAAAEEYLETMFGTEQDLAAAVTLDAKDLEIGGSGMRGFYDKIMVKDANRWLKQWGARVEFQSPEGAYEEQHVQAQPGPTEVGTVPYIRFTPEMKRSILEDGMEMFSIAPMPAHPSTRQKPSYRERLMNFWDKWFRAPGNLPKAVFRAKELRDADMGAEDLMVRHLLSDFDRAIWSGYKRSWAVLSKAEKEKVNNWLAGKNVTIPQSVQDALGPMRSHLDRLSMELALSGAIQNTETIQKIMDNRGTYLTRSYRAFDDPSWPDKVPDDVRQQAYDYLLAESQANGSLAGTLVPLTQVQIEEKINGIINKILFNGTAFEHIGSFLTESKLGAKDMSMLIRRKDIAKPIRDLLGEYKDPRVNFVRSAVKMERAIANHHFLSAVRNYGINNFLFEEPTGEYAMQIAAESSSTMSPLNGLYTTPLIHDAFVDAMEKQALTNFWRVILAVNGMVKYGKTVLSEMTMARNFLSAIFFATSNGHYYALDPRQLANAAQVTIGEILTLKGRRDYMYKMKRLGVVLDNPHAGELYATINDVARQDFGMTSGFGKFFQTFTRIYQAGDDFWKVIGFEHEKKSLMKYKNLSEEAAEYEAAERIRNTYPTYSKIGRSVKWLRRAPLVGTFVSFPAEIIRTSVNIMAYAAKDMASPATAPMAARRLVGAIISAAAFETMHYMSLIWLGLDDDDDEAVREQAPPWQRNSTLIYTNRDEDGDLRYFDSSSFDPYNYLKRPITALMTNRPWQDTLKSSMLDLASPFVGPDIAATAIGEVVFNKRIDSNGRVWNPDADPETVAIQMANHLRKALQPGTIGQIERMIKAYNGDVAWGGKEYKMNDELLSLVGVRMATVNPKANMTGRGFEFMDGTRNASRILNYALGSPNKIEPEEVVDKFEEMMRSRERIWNRMLTHVELAKKLGVSDRDVKVTLSSAGVGKSSIGYLLKGEIPRWRMSRTFLEGARNRALATAPTAERKAEIKEEFAERRRMILELRRAYYAEPEE